MKAYIITESDIQALLLALKEDPFPGLVRVPEDDRDVTNKAQRFYLNRIHAWLDRIRSDR